MRKLFILIVLIVSLLSCKKKEDLPSISLEINETSLSIEDTLFVTFKNNSNSICKYLVCDTIPNPHIDIVILKFNTSKNKWECFLSPFCGEKLLYLGGEIESGGTLKDTIKLSLCPNGQYKLMVAIKEYYNNDPVGYRELYSNEFLIH
jgi:hypothetical protein